MKKKFELVFTREFVKRLKRLDREEQIRILRDLKILEEKPFAGKQLVGRLSEVMSFRVGEYRVIYQISEKTIIIRTVSRREQVYKK
jgi:mRNA-degrading endonuclease RelE of RelBE toxin-antitoxin system